MANIVINEISQNYTYAIGTNSYACVALPITSCWGPGFFKPQTEDEESLNLMLESSAWSRFPATQEGLENFVAAYRGPATNYRLAKDYSYQMAVTLLTAGYDVLTCRLCPGTAASSTLKSLSVLTTEPSDWATDYINYYEFNSAEGKYKHVEPTAGYEDLTEEPSDWSTNYGAYYTVSDHTAVKGVPGYVVLSEEPSDWATNYANFFVLSGDGTYSPVAGVETYVKYTGNKPADWDSTYNTDYYVLDAGTGEYVLNENSSWIDVKNDVYTKQLVAPEFVPGGFYTEGTVAPEFAVGSYCKAVTDVAPEFEPDKYFEEAGNLTISAKYPGTFGNNLKVILTKTSYRTVENGVVKSNPVWSMIVYVVDPSGTQTAVENKTFVFDLADSTDNILYWEEVESNYVTLSIDGVISDSDASIIADNGYGYSQLTGGSDWIETGLSDKDAIITSAVDYAKLRYFHAGQTWSGQPWSGKVSDVDNSNYIVALEALATDDTVDAATANIYRNMEWVYTYAAGTEECDGVYSTLKDKLAYNPQRVISPGWDDQNIAQFTGEATAKIDDLSPLHVTLMDVAYYSRCATAVLDSPKSLARSDMYTYVKDGATVVGYAQKLAEFAYLDRFASLNINTALYSTHSALFAPWGQYTYVGTSKPVDASPSFLYLMISRAQILNQAIQYEWALPTNRKHNLRIGKLQYPTPKKILDVWQKLDGVGVNVITDIPGLGTNIWGNSTLFEVPPATYQALANLSTRLLVNAIEDIAFRCGIAITFQYNNAQAYNKFYAGVVPTLDTMKNVGAIEDYRIEMAADINGLDHVNANSVVGKIWITVAGVINDITIDLIALPAGLGLDLNSMS